MEMTDAMEVDAGVESEFEPEMPALEGETDEMPALVGETDEMPALEGDSDEEDEGDEELEEDFDLPPSAPHAAAFSAAADEDESEDDELMDDEDDEDYAEHDADEEMVDEALASFAQITGLSAMAARPFVEMADWDVARAIEIFYADSAERANDTARDDDDDARGGGDADATNELQRAVAPPGDVFRTAGLDREAAAEAPLPARFVPRMLARLFRLARRALSATPPIVGRAAAQLLARDFEEAHGSRHPPFFLDAYKHATAAAARQSKSLLVYLHSPLHEETEDFCRNVLGDEQFAAIVSQRFILWAADVSHADGAALASALRVTHFPFVAMLLCRPNGEEVVDRLQGETDLETLMRRLAATTAHHEEQLAALRMQRQSLDAERALRTEQDQEFERGLEADRQRDRANSEAHEIAEAEASALAEAEERDLAAEARCVREREEQLTHKREALGAEPPLGPSCARLRLQMPDGTKVDRRFDKAQCVRHVRLFVDVYLSEHADLGIQTYSLSTNYPRKVYGDEALDQTLAAAELGGKVLYVQDLDA